MKKTLAILATLAVAVGAFAQGKVTFGNDGTHLVTIVNNAQSLTAAGKDPALAGQPAPQSGANVMGSLTAQLWAGTSAGSLALQSTDVPNALLGDGRLDNINVTLTGIAGGATGFYQILIFETTAGSFASASTGTGFWYASTGVFSGAAGSFAPTPLVSYPSWTAGPVTLAANPVPEPATLALAGLGAASLLLFRRRKS